MATFDAIPNTELDIDKAVKSSTAKKFRDNPIAALEGDATAQAAGAGLFIEKDPGGGPQTGIITDETDIKKVLTPDGAGNAKWSPDFKPALILVERKEIAVAVSTVTFSSLDGNTDEVYKLIGRIENNVTANTPIFRLRPNGLSTDQNARNIINGVSSVIGQLQFIVGQGSNNDYSFEMIIHAKETVGAITMLRSFFGKSIEYPQAAAAVASIQDFGMVWRGAGNLISLDIHADISTEIQPGSTFELFKFAQA